MESDFLGNSAAQLHDTMIWDIFSDSIASGEARVHQV